MRLSTLGRPIRLYEPDRGSAPPAPAPAPAPTPVGAPADDRQNLQGLLQRHQGDAMAVIATLLSENHQLRDERRTLRGQVPAQGAVVLSGEAATQWQAYQQLGAPDALTQQLQAAETARQQLAGLQRSQLIRDVADAAGYKPAVLARLAGDTLAFAVRETTVDGKVAKTVVVTDGDTEQPLADYAKTQWADFLPSLTAAAPPPAGTGFVPQAPAGAQGAPDAVAAAIGRYQQQRDQVANPLAPAAPQRGPLG